jgi:DNA modification methylase
VTVRILQGDCRDVLKTLPDESVHCVVTSPPYWGLRDYGVPGQLGLEPTPNGYLNDLHTAFNELWRVLRPDGTVWLNLGDSYAASPKGNLNGQDKSTLTSTRTQEHSPAGINKLAIGLKPKDLIGIPWRVAFRLQEAGWWLRQDIIWAKPNPMPESVTDRCTKAHEYLFLLAKSERYYFDADAISETSDPKQAAHNAKYARPYDNAQRIAGGQPGNVNHVGKHSRPGDGTRNKRSVWVVATSPFSEAHFATFPPDLIEPCILAGCPEGGTVLDPFGGAGTTGLVADRRHRNAILIELNPEYVEMARRRIFNDAPLFAEVS